MNPKFKSKLLLIFVLIVGVIVIKFIPTFLFNELEFRQRTNYAKIEDLRIEIDRLVSLHTGASKELVSDQERRDATGKIDKHLETVFGMLNDWQHLLDYQDKIPFLPKNYRSYQALKKPAFNHYRDSLTMFQKVKTLEHEVAGVITQYDQTYKAMLSGSDLASVAKIAQSLKVQIESLYEKGKISVAFKNYVSLASGNIVEVADLALSGRSEAEIRAGLKEIRSRWPTDDFSIVANNWHEEIIDPLLKIYDEKNNLAIQGFSLADKFYLDNKLNKNTKQFIPFTGSFSIPGKIRIDLNGDGKQEYLIIEPGDPDQPNSFIKSMIAYDFDGNVIAKKPEEITILQPMEDLVKIHRLKTDDKKEAVSFNFIAGPHQSQIMFFDLFNDKLLPICLKEKIIGPEDCLLFTSNVGYLPVMDLDKDGFMEVIETTDEYPTEGKLTEEEQSAITKAAQDEEINEFTKDMEQIAKREKGGRGRTVVWAIFSYNGKIFEEQTGKDYDRLYNLIGDRIENIMKKSDLSGDSLAYLNLVRKLWNR